MSEERVYSEDEIKKYLSDKLPHWFYENGWISASDLYKKITN